jgi:hypothetical protein
MPGKGWLQRSDSSLSKAPKRPYGMSDYQYTFSLLIAHLVGSHVDQNGSIPGYGAWQSRHDERAMRLVTHYAHWAGVKVERDNRDPDECARAGASAVAHRIEQEERAQSNRSQVQISPGMIGRIFDVAGAINSMCDTAACDSGRRERMHQIHGEMIARGADSSGEITRTIAATLGVPEVRAVDSVGVPLALSHAATQRASDQKFFEGAES